MKQAIELDLQRHHALPRAAKHHHFGEHAIRHTYEKSLKRRAHHSSSSQRAANTAAAAAAEATATTSARHRASAAVAETTAAEASASNNVVVVTVAGTSAMTVTRGAAATATAASLAPTTPPASAPYALNTNSTPTQYPSNFAKQAKVDSASLVALTTYQATGVDTVHPSLTATAESAQAATTHPVALSKGALIAIIAAGGILFVTFVALALWWCISRCRKRRRKDKNWRKIGEPQLRPTGLDRTPTDSPTVFGSNGSMTRDLSSGSIESDEKLAERGGRRPNKATLSTAQWSSPGATPSAQFYPMPVSHSAYSLNTARENEDFGRTADPAERNMPQSSSQRQIWPPPAPPIPTIRAPEPTSYNRPPFRHLTPISEHSRSEISYAPSSEPDTDTHDFRAVTRETMSEPRALQRPPVRQSSYGDVSRTAPAPVRNTGGLLSVQPNRGPVDSVYSMYSDQ
ncbi:uncharacterized protein L969DRAFT_275010 [Mixia osmundae IAM 14324]|uniref:Uncharacterized protein n=1 Tax=Mixia osmundae (strain CBS 9802 / IAM 14324 / JCM 22182 / KY 12970) TaxID=764103 RepID=G7DUL2_MIXOS|nr:uncharacterized protein L969DRAFT_275010 [Mixia osmundae IAM 14324]KEI36394.1 hypothetical protein L969DRAFT_275010 [Mixia osmundae IAM 14324]GAA94272.1 hypothetical protein E5Q_00921 [Mixia osmundae IAM 14324]